MQKKYEHTVLFDNLNEAFDYQNARGGNLYSKKAHYDYIAFCAADAVSKEDIKRFKYVVADDFLVMILRREKQ